MNIFSTISYARVCSARCLKAEGDHFSAKREDQTGFQSSGCWRRGLSLRASGLWSRVVARTLARCVFYCFLITASLLSGSLYCSRQAASLLNAYEADTSSSDAAAVCVCVCLNLHVDCRRNFVCSSEHSSSQRYLPLSVHNPTFFHRIKKKHPLPALGLRRTHKKPEIILLRLYQFL